MKISKKDNRPEILRLQDGYHMIRGKMMSYFISALFNRFTSILYHEVKEK